MVFYDSVIFPDKIAYGSKSGPSTRSVAVEGDSGDVEAIARWPSPRRLLNAKYGIRSLADMNLVYDLWIAMDGPVHGFRIQDFYDYSTAANHRGTPAATDQVLGTYDGSTLQFQLIKKYTAGSVSKTRILSKPIAGSVVVAVNGTPTANFTVDVTTGIVTLTVTPTVGHVVTAGCRFHIAGQFHSSMDDEFQISVEAFDAGEIPDILIREMTSNIWTPESYYHGDGDILNVVNGSINQISFDTKRLLILLGPSGANNTLILPNPANLEFGGFYWKIIHSIASATTTIRNHTNTATVTTLTLLNSNARMVVFPSGGSRAWGAIK